MLPKNLKYQSKVEASPARSSRVNIQPQTGSSFTLGDTVTFNIPTRRNLVMVPSESYLRFDLSVRNTTGGVGHYRFDSCGAHGIIERLRLYHGSNLLEDMASYGMLAKMLMDLQVNTPSAYGKFNVLAGTRSDLIASSQSTTVAASGDLTTINGVAVTTAAATSTQLAAILQSVLRAQGLPCRQINSGDFLGTVAAGAYATMQTYCLNLISCIGSLSTQYFPLFACDSAPLQLQITFVDAITKFLSCVSGTGTVTISNVEFVMNCIELSDEAMQVIVGSLNGEPLQYVVPSYRNYINTVFLANNNLVNIPIPAKFSSLKALFTSVRDAYNTALYMPYSSVLDGLTSWQFRLGSDIAPTKAVDNVPSMFAECIKAIDSMSNQYHSPSIDKTSFSLNASILEAADTNYVHTIARGETQSGSFYIGLDLENYANAPKDTIFAGYNSNTVDIFLTLQYGNVGTPGNTRYDTFALFDQVLVFQNGTAFVRF